MPSASYNLAMPVFDEKQEELEHYETMMGVPRGRLAVTMDMITDAMALVGQHGVYCQSTRWPGKPVMEAFWWSAASSRATGAIRAGRQ